MLARLLPDVVRTGAFRLSYENLCGGRLMSRMHRVEEEHALVILQVLLGFSIGLPESALGFLVGRSQLVDAQRLRFAA